MNAVMLRNDLSSFFFCNGSALEVADDVGRAGAPTADDPREECGAHVTECGVVVLALAHHEAVVALGQGGIHATSPIRGHEERLA